jgi:hypothetical protein
MAQETILAGPRSRAEGTEEELEMTFQVALVGSDGVLLGSDRKMFTRPPSANPESMFHQFESQTKFVTNGAVICACSGNQESPRIAREILLTIDPMLPDLEWQARLDDKADIPNMLGHAQLAIARITRPDHVIWMVVGPSGYTTRIEEKRCLGANSSACFLTERFYQKKPIRSLTTLALLALE